jgi:hypothetical protein
MSLIPTFPDFSWVKYHEPLFIAQLRRAGERLHLADRMFGIRCNMYCIRYNMFGIGRSRRGRLAGGD